MTPPPRRCPAAGGRVPACPERPDCPAAPAATLPRDGAERTVMLALRFVAAAADTGDAACFDAAFDGAEAAFGARDGALVVARAAALVRALKRDGAAWQFLPPPCRFLSPGEARLLAALRLRLSGARGAGTAELSGARGAGTAELSGARGVGTAELSGARDAGTAELSGATRAALADLAVPVRAAGLPLLPPAVPRADARATV